MRNSMPEQCIMLGRTDKNGYFSATYGPLLISQIGHYDVYIKVAGAKPNPIWFNLMPIAG